MRVPEIALLPGGEGILDAHASYHLAAVHVFGPEPVAFQFCVRRGLGTLAREAFNAALEIVPSR